MLSAVTKPAGHVGTTARRAPAAAPRQPLRVPARLLPNVVQTQTSPNAQKPAQPTSVGGLIRGLLKSASKANGASENLITTDEVGRTALHVAVDTDNRKEIALLLAAAEKNKDTLTIKELLEACDQDGNTPLHLAESAEAVLLLCKAGANADAKNKKGNTALHLAVAEAEAEKLPVLKELLEQGAAVGFKNTNLDTPLHLAARNGHNAAVELLLRYGANATLTNRSSLTPLLKAVKAKQWDTVKAFAEHQNSGTDVGVNIPDKHGEGPLHAVSKAGEASVVDALLRAKANPFAANKDGDTPLHLAVKAGKVQAASALAAHDKRTLEQKNQDGKTAFHLAAAMNLAALTAELLKHASVATLRKQNKERKTALQVAKPRSKVRRLLKDFKEERA